MEQIRCACGKVLGLTDGQSVQWQHRGRRVTATLPAEFVCECCAGVVRVPAREAVGTAR
jgi:hypothetical protein